MSEFKGMFCPIVTPFKEDQSIDFESFEKVIDYVIDGGVDGLLIAGGTGEYHMMALDEQKEVIKRGIAYVNKRVPVLAGCSQTTPKATIELVNYAADCGADWGMALPPYYQPTTEQGLKDFYLEIADNTKIGIVMYNNPGATNVRLETDVVIELADHPNIIGLKDTDDMDHTCKMAAVFRDRDDFSVFQGFEHFILPGLLVGADGGFAILMNLLPGKYKELYSLAKEGKWAEARPFQVLCKLEKR